MLKPVKQKKISDQIYEQIRDMIYRGEFLPGQKLMAEREMASLFKVGRPTLRTAIQKLIDQGLVVAKRGVGTFVIDEDSRRENKSLLQMLNIEDFTISEFQEVRMALELKSAELAALRATEDDLKIIMKSIDRFRRERINGVVSMGSDISFHMNIAYAGKNMFQIKLMKSFYDVQYSVMDIAYNKLFHSMNIEDLIFDQHIKIAGAIKRHDSSLARESMEEHIGTILTICKDNDL